MITSTHAAAMWQRPHMVRIVQITVMATALVAGCAKSGSSRRGTGPVDAATEAAATTTGAMAHDATATPDASTEQRRAEALRAAQEEARPGVAGTLDTGGGAGGAFDGDAAGQTRRDDSNPMGNDTGAR